MKQWTIVGAFDQGQIYVGLTYAATPQLAVLTLCRERSIDDEPPLSKIMAIFEGAHTDHRVRFHSSSQPLDVQTFLATKSGQPKVNRQ